MIGKLSDVLYRVDCGRDHKTQIIHCDRMKLAKQQVLAYENPFEEHSVETEVFSEDEVSSQSEEASPDENSTGKRLRKKPVWSKDYYLYYFRLDMPLTKTTPRKYSQCVICKELVHREELQSHMLECVANRHECDECGSSFKKALYFNKHKKKMHDTKEASLCSKGTAVSDQEDWDKDPEVEIEVDSLESGRVIRKATQPLPVSAPKKAKVETLTSGSLIRRQRVSTGAKNKTCQKQKRKRRKWRFSYH